MHHLFIRFHPIPETQTSNLPLDRERPQAYSNFFSETRDNARGQLSKIRDGQPTWLAMLAIGLMDWGF